MTKNVLLTGATGFVGTQILKHLLSSHYNVIPVLRENSINKLDDSNIFQRIHTTEDLFSESLEKMTSYCENIDIVIHCAWYAEPGKYQESAINYHCLQGSLQLARASKIAGVDKFVGIGTCFEYEFSDKTLAIDSNLDPQSQYAIAKTALFLILDKFCNQNQISFTWCRLFYLYGENEDERRLHAYIRKQLLQGDAVKLGPGGKKRDYMDVEHAAKLIVKALQNDLSGPLNICSGIGVSVKEIAEEIAAEYGRVDLITYSEENINSSQPDCIIGLPSIS